MGKRNWNDFSYIKNHVIIHACKYSIKDQVYD